MKFWARVRIFTANSSGIVEFHDVEAPNLLLARHAVRNRMKGWIKEKRCNDFLLLRCHPIDNDDVVPRIHKEDE